MKRKTFYITRRGKNLTFPDLYYGLLTPHVDMAEGKINPAPLTAFKHYLKKAEND